MNVLKEFDQLKKSLKLTKCQRAKFSEIRKRIKGNIDYSTKLCTYFSDTLDGMEPEQSAKENHLL